MQPLRRGVIDVGTNSVKLLVADVVGHDVSPVLEESRQTRLGRGFYQTHSLRPDAIQATAEAVADFARKAGEQNSASVRVIATSAARDAQNGAELKSAIYERTGLEVEIISGEQEAEWAFRGVTSDPRFGAGPLMLLEVGGGSSQFIIGHAGEHPFRHSFRLGAVRLLERIPHSDPPTPEEFMRCRGYVDGFLRERVNPVVAPALENETRAGGELRFIATGGTASVMACIEAKLTHFDRESLEAVRFSPASFTAQVERLWSLPLEKRKQIPGLPPNRADIILTGSIIYQAVMEDFKLPDLRVSTRGLRFAAVMHSPGKSD